eukprot:EG_transcript_11174
MAAGLPEAAAVQVQQQLLTKLTSCPTTWPQPLQELKGMDPQAARLRSVLQQCVTGHHSQTCFVAGPPGCGKNLLVKHCLRTLPAPAVPHRLRVVHLYGSAALDDGSVERSILRSLRDDEADSPPEKRPRTDASAFAHIKAILDADAATLVLLVRRVDVLCRRCTRTLYSLADLVHCKLKSNVILLGTCHNLNVLETMDKRVKSRLNAQTILLSPITDWPTLRAALCPYLTCGAATDIAKSWDNAVEEVFARDELPASVQQALWVGTPFHHYKRVLFDMVHDKDFPSLVAESSPEKVVTLAATLLALPWTDRLPTAPAPLRSLSKAAASLLVAFARLEEMERPGPGAERGLCFRRAWDLYTLRFRSATAVVLLSEGAALDAFVRLLDARLLHRLQDPRRAAALPLTHQAVSLARDRVELKAELLESFPELDSFWNQQLVA